MTVDIKNFRKAFDQLKIIEPESGKLMIGDIQFVPYIFTNQLALEESLREMLADAPRGFLFEALPVETRRWLESSKISYMSQSGFAAIYLPNQVFLVRPHSRSARYTFRPSSTPTPEAKPSRLINPRGLAILDVITRLTSLDVSDMSGLAFAKEYGLAQPTLSKIQASIGARNLVEMRKVVKELGKEWWLNAMTAPRTGRGMTPFFRQAQEYRLHGRELNRKQLENWADEVLVAHPMAVFPGPLEVAKAIGAISDKTATFWVDPKVLPALKREFKLVPTRAGDEAHCAIATPKTDFQKESILSVAKDTDVRGLPSHVLSLNLFRAVWDLSYTDSRARESRAPIMEILLDAI